MDHYMIDPRLEAVCLPLAKEEYELLEKQVLRDGCLDPVKVWDRDGELVLLDGHNRLKICKDNKLPVPESTTIEISSIDEAVIWICDNQAGRRNLATKEQQDYLSGKRYEAQKNVNKFKGNQYTESGGTLNMYDQKAKKGKTVLKQAADEGVSHFKIQTNEKFAQGVDAIRTVSPGFAENILKPDQDSMKIAKGVVAAIPALKKQLEKTPEKFVEAVKEIEEALETKDKTVVEMVVRDHIKPGEPTHEEKMLAKKHNLKPEHVQYANEHNIPLTKMMTIEQLKVFEANKPAHNHCSNIWDGFYSCSCGIKFEMFASEHAPVCCPHCGKPENVRRG
jgi:hypothetical protein